MLEKKHTFLYIAILFAVGIYFFTRGIGFPPDIFPDSTRYSFGIRLQPYSDVEIPNYLYYFVYGVTTWFGPDFLEAARVMNVVFYLLAGLFIYKTARFGCGQGVSFFVTIVSLLFPTSLVTVVLMPESLYMLLLWALLWIMLSRRDAYSPFFWGLCGAYVGMMALVKVHALFLAPGLALYAVWTAKPVGSESGWKIGLRSVAFAALGFLLVKLGLGFVFAGVKGLTLLGTGYNAFVHEGVQEVSFISFLGYFIYMLFGHLFQLALLFAVPVAIMATTLWRERRDCTDVNTALTIAAAALLSTLILLSCLFSAFLAFAGPGKDDYTSIQTRYYSFVYPALFIVSAYWLKRDAGGAAKPRGERFIAVPLIILAVYGGVTRMSDYHLSFLPNDPEMAVWFEMVPTVFALLLAVVSLASICLWGAGRLRKACMMFQWLFVPLYVACATVASDQGLAYAKATQNVHKLAAEAVVEYLRGKTSSVTIYSDSLRFSSMFQYYLDDPAAKTVTKIMPGMLDRRLVGDTDWAILLGPFQLPPEYEKYRVLLGVVIEKEKPYELLLVRTSDFDLNANLDGKDNAWPVNEVIETPEGIVVQYALPLPEMMRIRIETDQDDSPHDTVFEVTIAGLDELLEIPGSGADGIAYPVRLDSPGRTIWIRKTTGGGANPVRLVIIPAEEPEENDA